MLRINSEYRFTEQEPQRHERMKVIGDRISILNLPATDRNKMRLLLLWLMAWTVCGIVVMANYFKITDENSRLFMIIYLSFWIYFEVSILRAFIWRRSGKEKLWVQNGILHYQREINRKGKIRQFQLDLISPLRLVDLKPTSFSDVMNQSFWVRGGERLEFQAQSKQIRLGMQITDEEARRIMHEINPLIP
jgi:hypothetical protein